MLERTAVIAPLPSPFTDDGSQLSEVRLARAIRWHKDRGAAGFYVGGEAGECFSLAFSERKQIIEWAVREAGELPVYVNASAPTTAAVLDLCQTGARAGAHGAVIWLPTQAGLTEDEARGLCHAVKRYSGIPLVVLDAIQQQLVDSGGLPWVPLAQTEFAPMTLARGLWTEEALVEGRILSPGALFGADSLKKMGSEWMKWKVRVGSLFLKDKGARIAKTLMMEAECDLGSPRPPLMVLEGQPRSVLRAILQDLEA